MSAPSNPQVPIIDPVVPGNQGNPENRETLLNQPPRQKRRRLVWIGVAVVVILVVLSRLMTQAPSSGQTALDNTGASRSQTGQSSQTATAATTPTPSKRVKPTPVVTSTNAPITSLKPGPLILLNPGVVRQGSSITVTGSGFDARAFVDLAVRQRGSASSLASTFVQADKSGTFGGVSLTVPPSLSSGSFTVDAHERNGSASAAATGTVAGGAPQVKLGTQVGKPGDTIAVALHGFAPGEPIKVYWNSLSAQPVTTFQADGGGGIGQAALQVPFGAVGTNTFLFVGGKSQSLVAATFQVLSLYPTVTLSSYALQADNSLAFSGSGFGPGERVLVYLNNPNAPPVEVIPTDNSGSFKNAGGFLVPFALKGQQTLIFMGEQSRAPDAVSFSVLPYAPVVQPSTYGGLPGTTISFFVSGFARDEVVHVYAGHTQSNMGTLSGCFLTDDHGSGSAAGSYLIPGNVQPGSLGFALVGAKSGGVSLASVNVTPPPAPVQTPPQQPFTCPLDQQNQHGQPSGSGASTKQPTQTPQISQGPQAQPAGTSSPAPAASSAPQGYVAHGPALASLSASLGFAVAAKVLAATGSGVASIPPAVLGLLSSLWVLFVGLSLLLIWRLAFGRPDLLIVQSRTLAASTGGSRSSEETLVPWNVSVPVADSTQLRQLRGVWN